MSFYIRKSLGASAIRFSVGERLTMPDEKDTPAFSTGPTGEYRRKSAGGLYFGEEREERQAGKPSKLRWPKLRINWDLRTILAVVIGGLLVLMGIAVVVRKGAQGIIEIVLGLAIIAIPFVLNAKKRYEQREREEKARLEREEIENRHRQLATALSKSFERLRGQHGPEMIEQVRQERQASAEVPYEAIAAAGRQTVLHIGFETLARVPEIDVEAAAAKILKIIEAVGLSEEDGDLVKSQLYERVVWHLLADDRLNTAQEEQLARLSAGLNLSNELIGSDHAAMEEFRRLRGVTASNLPLIDVDVFMRFKEYCHHSTTGELLKKKWQNKPGAAAGNPVRFLATNKRLIFARKKQTDVPLAEVSGVELDADVGVLTITHIDGKQRFDLRLPDPIYTGSIVDLAAEPARKRSILE